MGALSHEARGRKQFAKSAGLSRLGTLFAEIELVEAFDDGDVSGGP